jgi:RNA polymerase sigma-70 factor (ECF subfamily)
MPASEDLAAVLAALLDGDRLAFLRMSRLVTRYLIRLRAYDFRDEWPDLVQEVVNAVTAAARAGKLREPDALPAFVLAVTRHKFADRLKAELRVRGQAQLAWELATLEAGDPLAPLPQHVLLDLRRALAELPEKKGEALLRVYVEGKTYEEVAAETGIPLGTLKRYLRDGLAELRRRLSDPPDDGGAEQ